MKSVKFEIKTLGAIKDSVIELKPLMLFSGESGLGKSYVAFLAHYLYLLLTSERLKDYFNENQIDLRYCLKGKKANDTILSIDVNEFLSWINRDAIRYIGYLLGHDNFQGEVQIKLPIKDKIFSFIFDEEIVGLDNNEEVFYKIRLNDFTYRFSSDLISEESDAFFILVRAAIVDAIFGDHTFLKRTCLLPPSRGALIELAERPKFLSGMYDEFFDFKVEVNRPTKIQKTIDEDLLWHLSEINKGDIQSVESKLMYYTKSVPIPITAAASSIKELAPLTLLLKKYDVSGTSILFEEPEAHLHPARQLKVAGLIGYAVNKNAHIQITTHSDYFIKRLNVLINLFRLKSDDTSLVKNLCLKYGIKESSLIDPENVVAYLLERNKDGCTTIKEQNIIENDGIPFSSFYNVIDQDIRISGEIRKELEK